ncbi:MAG: (2Fe-2S) ferredoxin domain-containing protein [Leptolyngbya sp.]|nr:(2Fe-2S) ferredoxin domain-containing protein [Leptolyngbya sp.]
MRDQSSRFSPSASAVMAVPAPRSTRPPAPSPQGHLLRGRYAEPLRSAKGKIKGLILRTAAGEVAVKLPKYLRPMLRRELQPGAWVQVWACRRNHRWRGFNLVPWPDAEVPQALKDDLIQSATVVGKATVAGKNVDDLPAWAGVQDGPANQGLQVLTKHASEPPSSTKSAATKPACIQVCRKGKCFRQGGQHILQALQSEVERNPDLQHITVEGTGCMGACKQGPNLRMMPQKKLHSRVTPDRAVALLAHAQ